MERTATQQSAYNYGYQLGKQDYGRKNGIYSAREVGRRFNYSGDLLTHFSQGYTTAYNEDREVKPFERFR